MTQPRPLREGDTLGRAGRTGQKGGPIETARARRMTPEDQRRATINDWGVPGDIDTTGSLIVYQPPVEHAEPGEHRAMVHLDGRNEPRVPKQWEDQRAKSRGDVGQRERELMLRDLRKSWATMKLSALAAHVERFLLTAGAPRAKQSRLTDAKGAESDRTPRGEGHGAVGFAEEREVDAHLRLARLHLERVAEHDAAHRGLPVVSLELASTEVKDALLCGEKLRGLSPVEVASVYGDALGSVKHIGFVRSCAGLDRYGWPLREERAA